MFNNFFFDGESELDFNHTRQKKNICRNFFLLLFYFIFHKKISPYVIFQRSPFINIYASLSFFSFVRISLPQHSFSGFSCMEKMSTLCFGIIVIQLSDFFFFSFRLKIDWVDQKAVEEFMGKSAVLSLMKVGLISIVHFGALEFQVCHTPCMSHTHSHLFSKWRLENSFLLTKNFLYHIANIILLNFSNIKSFFLSIWIFGCHIVSSNLHQK